MEDQQAVLKDQLPLVDDAHIGGHLIDLSQEMAGYQHGDACCGNPRMSSRIS